MANFYTTDPWNQLHDGMELYHNHFRQTFNDIYKRCENVDANDLEELEDLLSDADGLYRHLNAHHSIEEYSRLIILLIIERTYFLYLRKGCLILHPMEII